MGNEGRGASVKGDLKSSMNGGKTISTDALGADHQRGHQAKLARRHRGRKTRRRRSVRVPSAPNNSRMSAKVEHAEHLGTDEITSKTSEVQVYQRAASAGHPNADRVGDQPVVFAGSRHQEVQRDDQRKRRPGGRSL